MSTPTWHSRSMTISLLEPSTGQTPPNNQPPQPTAGAVVEIQDDEDNVSVLTTKTGADNQPEVVVGSQAPSGSNPFVGPTTAAATQTKTVSGGSSDPASAGPAGGAVGGPVGKYLPLNSLLIPQGGRENTRNVDRAVSGHLRGAGETSNVRRSINGKRLAVGSNNY
jgi:hypothetical protein